MDEPFETTLTIVAIILILLFSFGTPTVRWIIVGVLVFLVLLFVLILRIDKYKERKREKRASIIAQKYPDAFAKYRRNNRLRAKFDDWKYSQWKDFLSITVAEWEQMQHEEEERIASIKRIHEQFSEIEKLAPKGLEHWINKNNLYASWKVYGDEIEHLRETTRKGQQIITKKEVIANKDIILQYEEGVRNAERFSEWNSAQIEFSSEFNQLAKGKLLNVCGLSKTTINYTLPEIAIEEVNVNFVVHHYYFHGFCLDKSLDYSLFPSMKSYTDYIENDFNSTESLPGTASDTCYYGLGAFFNTLFKSGELTNCSFVFCDDVDTVKKDHFSKKYDAYLVRNAIARMAGKFGCASYHLHDVLSGDAPELSERIIIIGHVAYISDMQEKCKQILTSCKSSRPNIVYISVFKEIDSQSMQKEIDKKKKILAEEEDIKRKEEERKLHEQEIINSIPSKVKDWEALWNGLNIKYLLDYYPTTVDFETNYDEWADRWTVWHFKNDPEKNPKDAHERVLERIVPQFARILKDTFGEEALKYLTLVCIPASTKEKNDARYKDFSERLCQETGIENGFSHIHLTRDRVAKREGGNADDVSIANYSFDDIFFNGKRVILLDDIITKGNSMRIAKAKLEKLGAQVICGLSVGKTRHERRNGRPDMDKEQ